MDELSSLAKSGFKEWIATRPSFVKSTHLPGKDLPDSEKVVVAKGARLIARQTGRRHEFLLVTDAVLDGQPLPRNLTHIHVEHWAAVPPKAAADSQLTEARLVNARWQFGKAGEAPLSTSLHFARDGRIKGYFSPHEKFWNLENGDLHILTESGKSSRLFRLRAEVDGRLNLVGFSQLPGNHDYYELTEMPAAVAAAKPVVAAEAGPAEGKQDDTVKLIIWDLDDTFWQGTLAEGGITPIQAHIDFIKTISARGIVNSICSKNEFERTKAELGKLGIWEYFIFPRIDFAPKGAMIRDIIEAAQLRTPSVLFIDDNSININEALHYNPGLQTCLPDAIAGLLADPRCKGKPDPNLTRLERYKVLESKNADRASAGADNLDFLRNSDVRISFHHEIGDEFPRIHDLVNRTNQLNFTKKRWPEDEAEAKQVFLQEQELNNQNFHSHWGYVKVADKYGSYGICGFYLVRQSGAYHFLFSCRSLNMGIEQFVWQKIGRPQVTTVGEVVATLGDDPDWITVVDDADAAPAGLANMVKTNICVHGACDLAMMTHYLRMRYDMIEEFAFPFQDWEIHPVARAVAVYDEIISPAGQALLKKMPGMPPRRFESSIHTGESDVYILSFSSELFCALYESKSTGMVLPLNYFPFSRQDFKKFSYQDVLKKSPNAAFSEADWKFMQREFKLVGELDLKILAQDVEAIFKKLRGKIVIVLNLSTSIGNNKWVLGKFARINEVVQPLVQAFGYDTIDLGALIRDENDLVNPKDGGVHFKREIYRKMAEQVTAIVEARQAAVPSLDAA